MLKHYLTSALRHFARHKTTTTINLICLALGLVCFLAVHSVVTAFNNSDRQFADADRIYAITQKYIAPGSNMNIPTVPLTAWPAAEYLKTDIPELEAVARLNTGGEAPVSVGANKTFAKLTFADPSFFDIFDWPFLAGDAKNALRDTRSVVLTEATAIRLFGSPAKALGQSLLLHGATSLSVTGVIAPLRGLSHMSEVVPLASFDILAPMELLVSSTSGAWMRNNWNSPVGFTYVRLPADGSFTFEALKSRLATFDRRYVPAYEWQAKFGAVPLPQVFIANFNSLVGTDKTGMSVGTVLYILGALVLFVSILNYANLATAQATARAKEIGLRRVVGAGRLELAAQYIGEATLLTLAAALVAQVLVTVVATPLLSTGDSAISFAVTNFVSQLPLVLAVVLGVGFLAGAYPAFVLSRIAVAEALRSGRVRTGPRFVPSLLVAIQFSATSFLIIAILVMSVQHKSMQQNVLSKEGDPLVVISNDLSITRIAFDTIRSELLAQPHIRGVTASRQAPWEVAGSLVSVSVSPDSAARRWTVCNNDVQRDYLKTMDIPLIAGRAFDPARASDNAVYRDKQIVEGTSVIIDRALAEQSGWTPNEAIGKSLHLWRPGATYTTGPAVRVIGVVENKPLRLLGLGATSNLFLQQLDAANLPIIRIDSNDVAAGLREIDAVWTKLAPNVAIKRRFASEVLNNSLAAFKAVTKAFQMIALLASSIAVLGLIGMSLHIIRRRTHEIGVRKTMGASVQQILTLLLKDFSKPVLIANLVAWPFAFVTMTIYLNIFVTRTALSLTPFIASMLLTLLIAWLAVLIQASRAARMNPATVLRHE